jgi:hypothetical protein
LNSHLLIVAIDCVNFIDCEGPVALAHNTLAEELLPFIGVAMENGAFKVSTRAAVENTRVFREYTCALGNNTSYLNKGIHVDHSKITKMIFNWKILDSCEDNRMDVVIIWEQL